MDYPHIATYIIGPATLIYAAIFYAAILHKKRRTVIGLFIGLCTGFTALTIMWITIP